MWKTFKRILFSRNFVSSTPYALVASPPTLLSATCFPGGGCLPSGRPPAWVLSGPSGATGQEGGEEPDAKPCSDLIEGRPDRWRRGAGEQRGFRSHGDRQEGPETSGLASSLRNTTTPRPSPRVVLSRFTAPSNFSCQTVNKDSRVWGSAHRNVIAFSCLRVALKIV